MIKPFPNDIISDYFKNIRKLLYVAEGRSDLPPKNPLDFNIVDYRSAAEIINPGPNKNSFIKLSPNMSFLEFREYRTGFFDYKPEQRSYDEDFLKFPIDTHEISEEIEIDCYFYKYSFLDEKDIYHPDIASITSEFNFNMPQSDFLYKTIYSKFVSTSDNYQKCLTKGIEEFQLNKKVDEEIILHHFIEHYNDILNSNDKQLKIFEHVKTTKQVADLYTKILIEFLTLKLKNLQPETDKLYIAQSQGMSVDGNIEKKIVIELPENLSLEDLKIKSKVIDIKETGILFYFLRKHGAIIDYSDSSYSKLIRLLTGYSNHNIRQKKGLGNITNILKMTKNGVKYYYTKKVIRLLESVVSDLKNNIKE